MKATISIFAVLAIALTVQAKPEDSAIRQAATAGHEISKGDATPYTPIVMPQGNNCGDVTDEGVLPGSCCWGMPMSTTGQTDDFDNGGLCSAAEYSTGGGASDSVIQFQADSDGIWNFWTCGTAGWDTTLQVFIDGGAGCPATPAQQAAQVVGCNGDGCGAPPWESDLYVVLLAGETYYLVLDGWSAGYSGSATIVFYNSAPLCTNDEYCDDGLNCNGFETCDHQFGPDPDSPGLCQPGGGSPCESYQSCVEADPYDCIDPDPCLVYYQPDQNSSYFAPAFNNGYDALANEIAYREGAGRELVSYDLCVSGRGTCEFDFTSSLWTVDPTTGDNGCFPMEMVPGTACAYHQLPDPGGTLCHQLTCDKSGDGIILPDNPNDPFAFADERCGIDVYMMIQFSDERPDCDSHGLGLASHYPTVGSSPFAVLWPGPVGVDGVGGMAGRDIVAQTWGIGQWSEPSVSDNAWSAICTEVAGPCCYDTGGCDVLSADDCAAAGGTYGGDNTLPDPHFCTDSDGDGFDDMCDNCPGVANPGQEDCNDDGEGDACDPDAGEIDTDGDGCCDNVDACPDDANKCADSGQCGCGEDEIDSDGDGTMNCIDGCPLDANKTAPGCCGCGFADTDVDGDGFFECAPDATPADPTCVDTCPNVDDAQFGPCDPGTIPTVSEWGLVVMALLLLVAGKVYFGRRTVTG